MTVTIRPYQEKDRDQLLACISHLQEWEHSLEPSLKNSGDDVAHSFFLYFVEGSSEDQGKLLVAELNGHVVGFIHGYLEEDRDAKDLLTRRWFYLSDLAVLPQYKGQNIGGELIKAIENYARHLGLSQIKLDVLAKNTPARSFYAKHGYQDYEHVVVKTIAVN